VLLDLGVLVPFVLNQRSQFLLHPFDARNDLRVIGLFLA
jgi:hypothetical protein